MNAPRIIWPVLLAATGLTGWLTISKESPAFPARIKVENDVADISGSSGSAAAAGQSSYDPCFIQANRCDRILIPASRPK